VITRSLAIAKSKVERSFRIDQDNLNTQVKESLCKALLPAEARRILDKIEFYYTTKRIPFPENN
jgi:hypothetical protein